MMRRGLHDSGVPLAGAALPVLLACMLVASPQAQARDEFANCGPGLQMPARPDFEGDLDRKVIQISADDADLSEEGISLLRGNVQYNNGDLRLASERMRYDKPKERVRGRGNVRLWERDLFITAQEAELNTLSGAWDVRNGSYIRPEKHARGDVQRMTLTAEDIIRVEEGTYTTCNPDDDAWILEANHIELNQLTDVGTATDVKILVKGVPVFYTPWMTFPLSDKRKSGLLAPVVGVSGSTGVDITVPYYFNLAPHFDATFAPRVMSQRGVMAAGDFRYLGENGGGQIAAEFLPDDLEDSGARGGVSFQYDHRFSSYWTAKVDYSRVSDSEYFEDFGNSLPVTSNSFLPQLAETIYNRDGWQLHARALNYQTVDSTVPKSSRPYRVLPQLRLSRFPTLRNRELAVGGFVDTTYFDNSSRVNGVRFSAEPYVSFPMRTPGTYFIPTAKIRYAHYELDNTAPGVSDSQDRFVPGFSLDTGAVFERDTSLFGDAVVQTLEPRVYYLFNTFDDQSDVPVFDSSEYTFTFAQLFRDNRFTGGDRVADAHQVSLALSSRLLDPASGDELARGSIGQIFHLRDRRVQLPGGAIGRDSTSDLVGEVAANLARGWSANAGGIYDPHEGRTERATIGVRYQPAPDKVVNASYRFVRGTSETTDLSARWPVMDDVGLVGRWTYALADERTLDAFGGIEYDTCCWTVRAVGRRSLADTTGDYNNSVFLQFELKGLAGVGRSTERFLERSIPGYQNPF